MLKSNIVKLYSLMNTDDFDSELLAMMNEYKVFTHEHGPRYLIDETKDYRIEYLTDFDEFYFIEDNFNDFSDCFNCLLEKHNMLTEEQFDDIFRDCTDY